MSASGAGGESSSSRAPAVSASGAAGESSSSRAPAVSASEAAAESSSSRARQDADAEPEPPQRRWVALVSKPIILANAKDARARAMGRDTNVGLVLDDPPRLSYLVLHPRRIVALNPAAGDDVALQPSAYILAADRSGRLLFRVTKPNPDHGINEEPATKEELYLCNTHSRIATRLPPVPTHLGVQLQPRRSVGLVTDPRPNGRRHHLVVQLCPRPRPLFGDTLLYYDNGERGWIVKAVHTTTAVRDRNLRGEAGVVAHAGRLYWLALGYGIFFCDPFAMPSHLRFVQLPDGCMILEELSEFNRVYVTLRRRVAPSEGHLRFVEVQGLSTDDDEPPPLNTNPSVRMWTLVEPEGEEPWWRPEYNVPFAEVWEHESYATFGLPHGQVPHVAFVDPDNHRVVYLHHFESSKIFGLDLRTKGIVSCEDCSVRDDREIMLQNSRPIIDAWEQVAPTPDDMPSGRRIRYLQHLARGLELACLNAKEQFASWKQR